MWVEPTPSNAPRVMRALRAFGAPLHEVTELAVDFIGRDAFIRNKRATGRARDLGDIEGL